MPSHPFRWFAAVWLALGALGEAAQTFPKHWGNPPAIQTRDIVALPGGYGQGSTTLANWIRQNLERDAGGQKSPRETALGKGVLARGELRVGERVALILAGPPADGARRDYRVSVRVVHESGAPALTLRAAAAKGEPAHWVADFSPKAAGSWRYRVNFAERKTGEGEVPVPGYDGRSGQLEVGAEASPR